MTLNIGDILCDDSTGVDVRSVNNLWLTVGGNTSVDGLSVNNSSAADIVGSGANILGGWHGSAAAHIVGGGHGYAVVDLGD